MGKKRKNRKENKKLQAGKKYADPYELKGEENTSYLKEIAGLTALMGGVTAGAAFMPNGATRVAAASVDTRSQIVGSVAESAGHSGQTTNSKSDENNFSVSASQKLSQSTSRFISHSASLSLSQSGSVSLSQSLSQSISQSESLLSSLSLSKKQKDNKGRAVVRKRFAVARDNSQLLAQDSNNSNLASLSESTSTPQSLSTSQQSLSTSIQQSLSDAINNSQSLLDTIGDAAGLVLLNTNGIQITNNTNSLQENKTVKTKILATQDDNNNIPEGFPTDPTVGLQYYEGVVPTPQGQYFYITVTSGILHNVKQGQTFTVSIGKDANLDLNYSGGTLSKYLNDPGDFDAVNNGDGTYTFTAKKDFSEAGFSLRASMAYEKVIDKDTSISVPVSITNNATEEVTNLPAQTVEMTPNPKNTEEATHPDLWYKSYGLDRSTMQFKWGVYVNFNEEEMKNIDVSALFDGNQKLLKNTITVYAPLSKSEIEQGTLNNNFDGSEYNYDLSKLIQDGSTDNSLIFKSDNMSDINGTNYSKTPIYIVFNTQLEEDGKPLPPDTIIKIIDYKSTITLDGSGIAVKTITNIPVDNGNGTGNFGNNSQSISASTSGSYSTSSSQSVSTIESRSNSLSVEQSESMSESLSNSVSMSESLSNSVSMSESLSNSVSMSESLSNSVSMSESLSNSVSMSESLSNSVSMSESLSNSVSMSESLSNSVSMSESLSNSVSMSESLSNS
ncbi:MAG: hypothetical protein HDR42_04260, partial [Lactobacillus sp.]|nr:hypothetical protein [Lactobacillus sp.]